MIEIDKDYLFSIIKKGIRYIGNYHIDVIEYSESIMSTKYWVMVTHIFTNDIIYRFQITPSEYKKYSTIDYVSKTEIFQNEFKSKSLIISPTTQNK